MILSRRWYDGAQEYCYREKKSTCGAKLVLHVGAPGSSIARCWTRAFHSILERSVGRASGGAGKRDAKRRELRFTHCPHWVAGVKLPEPLGVADGLSRSIIMRCKTARAIFIASTF